MSPPAVFVIQFAWFAAAWAVVAVLAVWPWSRTLDPPRAVSVWVAPQMFRILGLGLLVPNLSPGMPAAFAVPTAIGDSVTAALALAAFVALQRNRPGGDGLAWACTVVGSADLMHALVSAPQLGVAENLAAQWYVPVLVVPLMGVTHVACVLALLRARRIRSDSSSGPAAEIPIPGESEASDRLEPLL
jgi:hypothetical protein